MKIIQAGLTQLIDESFKMRNFSLAVAVKELSEIPLTFLLLFER